MGWRDRLATVLATEATASDGANYPHANCAKSANCPPEAAAAEQLAQLAQLAEGHFAQNGGATAEPPSAPAGEPPDERTPAPPPLPPIGSPERAALDAKQAEMVAGLLAASRIRPSPPAAPVGHPTDAEVEALARVLAARPAQAVTDPARAMAYFSADARRRLLLGDDFLARVVRA